VQKFRISWILIFLVVLLFSGKAWLERYISSTAIEEVSPRKVVYWLAQSHSEEAVLGDLTAGLGFKEVLSDLFFLQSIQYFGSWEETKERVPPFTGLRKKCLGKGGNEASQWN
jgi:hypothetical protein